MQARWGSPVVSCDFRILLILFLFVSSRIWWILVASSTLPSWLSRKDILNPVSFHASGHVLVMLLRWFTVFTFTFYVSFRTEGIKKISIMILNSTLGAESLYKYIFLWNGRFVQSCCSPLMCWVLRAYGRGIQSQRAAACSSTRMRIWIVELCHLFLSCSSILPLKPYAVFSHSCRLVPECGSDNETCPWSECQDVYAVQPFDPVNSIACCNHKCIMIDAGRYAKQQLYFYIKKKQSPFWFSTAVSYVHLT